MNGLKELAEQAGFHDAESDVHAERLEAFAKLVAAKEREACAKVAESFGKYESDVADAIRAQS